MCRRCLCTLLTVVAILVMFMRPYGAAAQQPTPRAYLPIALGGTRPLAGPTSDHLIDQALARGEIDSETALTYKVFAAFGDPRLPAAYHGDDSQLVDSHILAEVQARYAGLSATTQATLNPFLIPPAYVGSWDEPLPAAPDRGPLAPNDTPPPCENLDFDRWAYYLATMIMMGDLYWAILEG
jgi:hypothetical protein